MRTIKLISLEMTNFKGEQHRKTVFNDDAITTIMGRNGIGKSRHFDAFTWCLWGKDVLDRKDFEIQTRTDDGEILHKVDTEVELVLNVVDGDSDYNITLNRRMSENWVKPRNAAEEKLKNRVTSCKIDEVPVSVTEYTKRVNELLDDNVFKMVSNPFYFSTILDWKKRRAIMLEMAGQKSDDELISGHDDLVALFEKFNGKTIEEYKRMINEKKKKAKEELEQIQPRIDQTFKIMPEEKNWADIESQIANLDESIKSIDKQLTDASAAVKVAIEKKKSVMAEIMDAKKKQASIVAEENARIETEYKKANASHDEMAEKLMSMESDKGKLMANRTSLNSKKAHLSDMIKIKTEKVDSLRDLWMKENKKSVNDYVCPTCLRPIEPEKANEAKIAAMAKIREDGLELNRCINDYQKDLDAIEREIAENKVNFELLCRATTELRKEIESCACVEKGVFVPEFNQEWMALEATVKELEKKIDDADVLNIDNGSMNEAKSSLMDERDDLKKQLADKALIEKLNKEVDELEQKARDLVQVISTYHMDEDLIDEYTRMKVEDCEERVNSMFKIVRFKMFKYTLDGVQEECCIPMVNGVPFEAANSTGKINAGIDMLNALSMFYNVSAPVWVDNAESYNDIMPTNGQTILLKVTKDENIVIQ